MEARKAKNTALVVLAQLLGRAVHCFSQNGRAGVALGLNYPLPAEAEKSLRLCCRRRAVWRGGNMEARKSKHREVEGFLVL